MVLWTNRILNLHREVSTWRKIEVNLTDSLDFKRLPLWNAEIDDVLVCQRVKLETHDVKTFVFASRTPAVFKYWPGQFLTFEFDIHESAIHRCYTLASSSARPHLISITVKRVLGGKVSNWLHDNMKVGMSVKAVGPMGDFTSAVFEQDSLLLLSGGSGVTPMMSMVRSYYDLANPTSIVFVHSARSTEDIIFKDELTTIARDHPWLDVKFVCEVPTKDDTTSYAGRLNRALIERIVPDFRSRRVFTCGPPGYMTAAKAMMRDAGLDMGRYHEESFEFSQLPSNDGPAAQTVASPAGEFNIEFRRSGRTITCGASTSILNAARQAGLFLPSSCSQGICGTCKSTLVSGTVDMTHGGGIRRREIEQGKILICCSRPTSNLVIDQ
jgi:ferredoxin-NADP reductase